MKDSERRVLDFLVLRGDDGATEAEIQAATGIRSGAQRIHELKAEGHRIDKAPERTPMGAVVARWYYRAAPRRFAPVTGVQEGLAL